jgi:hypothetical protein
MRTLLRPHLAAGAALAFAATLGCVSLRAPLTAPHEGGPPWTEITSPHFVLETDVDPRAARTLVADFEKMYAALAYVVQRRRDEAMGRIELVLFEREQDFHEACAQDRTKGAYFSTKLVGDLEPQPIMVMHDELLDEERRGTFLHELAHRFIHERFAHVPTWLDEGLAQFYSTLRLEDGRIVMGADLPGADFWSQTYFMVAWHGNSEQLLIPVLKAPHLRDLVEAGPTIFYPSYTHEDVSRDDRAGARVNVGERPGASAKEADAALSCGVCRGTAASLPARTFDRPAGSRRECPIHGFSTDATTDAIRACVDALRNNGAVGAIKADSLLRSTSTEDVCRECRRLFSLPIDAARRGSVC